MQEHDLTHRELAEVAGVSKAAVGKWLKGTIPGAGEVFKIAHAFNKPMEWFFQAIPDEPASEAEKAGLLRAPELIPSDKFRSAAQSVGLSSPHDLERLIDLSLNYRQVWTRTPKGIEMHYEPIHPTTPAPEKESANQVLTQSSISAKLPLVKSSRLDYLLAGFDRLIKQPGKKTELAGYLGAPLASVSRWIAQKREPGREITLKMLRWVEDQELQQKKTPESASTLSGGKTQFHSSKSNEKAKSSPKKN